MSQKTITIAVTLAISSAYVACAMRNGKRVKYDDVIMFGVMVGGMVTGGFLIVMAFGDTVPTTGSLYVALLGLALIVVSGQKACAMFKSALTGKRAKGSAVQPASKRDSSNQPPSQA